MINDTGVTEAKSKPNMLLWLIIALMVVVFGALFLVVLSVVISIKDKENEDGTQGEIVEAEEDDAWTKEQGEFVRYQVPSGWEVREYKDGEGTDMIAENTLYETEGLTGFKVFNAQGKEIFSLKAVSGIGGASPCSQIFEFKDTDPAYIQEEKDYAEDLPTNTPTEVVDLGDKQFVEFDLLDQEVRRVGKTLYFNNSDVSLYFNPACKLDRGMRIIEDLEFKFVGTGYEDVSNSYSVDFILTANTEDLEILDEILESMEAI